jgi:SAM-dependent methyltransferase
VWRDLDRVFHRGQRILELNCGTGIDAVHLAARGTHVLACDISSRMIQLARDSVPLGLPGELQFRVLPTEHIAWLEDRAPFDGAFSNFSGLNCVEDLASVARDLSFLLKPRAPLVVCIIGRFVPWEIVWFLAHGEPRRAFARARGKVEVEPGAVKVQHPSVREMARLFAPYFELRWNRGVGITVPPSYLEHWACRFPRATRLLAGVDEAIDRMPLFRNLGDCVLLEFLRVP